MSDNYTDGLNDDILDLGVQDPKTTKANTTLNVFCILGYIANGFWLLLFLIIALMGVALLGSGFQESFRSELNINNVDDAMTFLSVVMFGIIVICILSIVGLVMAHKKKTGGFILYAIANGLWAIMFLISGFQGDVSALIFGLLSVLFIVIIGVNHKK